MSFITFRWFIFLFHFILSEDNFFSFASFFPRSYRNVVVVVVVIFVFIRQRSSFLIFFYFFGLMKNYFLKYLIVMIIAFSSLCLYIWTCRVCVFVLRFIAIAIVRVVDFYFYHFCNYVRHTHTHIYPSSINLHMHVLQMCVFFFLKYIFHRNYE